MESIMNLHSVSVCDLNTKFHDRCQTDWSRSNFISVVTPDGIYILKPQLDERQGPFQMELIRNPKVKFSHNADCKIGPKFDEIWQQLDSRQYNEVLVDPCLRTNVENYSLDLYQRGFRLAKWSPLIESFPRDCLLAALTLDYQLLVFARKNSAWIARSDLSRDYDLVWPRIHPPTGGTDFDSIRRNLQALSFCCISWKEVDNAGPLLLATTISGDIIVWQVISYKPTSEGANSFEFLDIKMVIATGVEHISSTVFHDDLLFVSSREGQILLYDMTSSLSQFTQTPKEHESRTNGNTAPKTLQLLNSFPPTAAIWLKDNIEVADLYIQQLVGDTIRIVLAKGTNICWSNNRYKKKTEHEPATLELSNSFSGIDGLDQEINLHQTAASWLRPAGNEKAILIAEDGSFFQFEFANDGQDSSPSISAIKTGNVNLANLVPRGLCNSPNGHLTAMISSLSLMYDSSKVTNPSKIILLPILNDKSFLDDSVRKLLDENYLASEDIRSPMDVCDRIDYVRSIIPLLTNEQVHDLYDTFKEAVLNLYYPKNRPQLVKLKIGRFILSRLLRHDRFKMIDPDQDFDLAGNIDDVIFLRYIEDVLTRIFEKKTAVQYSKNQMNSLGNYFSWLQQDPERTRVYEAFIGKFKELANQWATGGDEELGERCPICAREIPFTSIKHGTCCNEHYFDRCARSLLVMDIQICDELICEQCERHYMTHILWPSENLWLCSYCQ